MSEIKKRFHLLDASGSTDFIILKRQKKDLDLPPDWRPYENQQLSDIWSPTTKLEQLPLMAQHIRVPHNIEFRNGQKFHEVIAFA